MKCKILNSKNEETGTVTMPGVFAEQVRPDLIKRAVVAIQANKRQSYGADPEAGKKHSAELSRRRRKYRGAYGKGISRVPRKIMSRNGAQMHWVGALAPGTRGGRQAHPSKAQKDFSVKINDAERKKAVRSAIAATVVPELVARRGHVVPATYPFVLDVDFEKLAKTKDVATTFTLLGLQDELVRSQRTTVRAGKGKMRNRRLKRPVGPLVVVADSCEAVKAARNIPGVQVVRASQLNAEILAPGAQPGRLTLYTKSAIDKMGELYK